MELSLKARTGEHVSSGLSENTVLDTLQSGETAGPADGHLLTTALVPGIYVQVNSLAMDLGTSLKAQILVHKGSITHPMGC